MHVDISVYDLSRSSIDDHDNARHRNGVAIEVIYATIGLITSNSGAWNPKRNNGRWALSKFGAQQCVWFV